MCRNQTMLIHSVRKANLPPLSIRLLSTLVQQVHTTKFLGVCINDTLTWREHVQYVAATVSTNLNLLRCLSWFLPEAALLLFYRSYILPSFDYCDVVWGCCSNEEALLLERLQNFAARAILHQCRWQSASSARKQLSLSTLSCWRDFHLAQHSCRAICGLHPPYLKCLFTLSTATHGHHTRLASLVSVKEESLQLLRCSLPSNAREVSTISVSSSTIKPFLLTSQ